MLMFVCALMVTAYGIDGPSDVVYVNKITDMFIEVGYTKGFDGKNLSDSDYKVTVNGREVEFKFDAFFDDAATLRLNKALTDPEKDEVKVTTQGKEITAKWVPFYTFTNVLDDKSAAERGNQGTKSKIWVYGNEESGCTDKDARYTADYVIRYCAEGINKMVGRSDFLTLSASRQDLRVVVVGSGNSVYTCLLYTSPSPRDCS